jgi:hypothetical protein
MRIHRTLLVVAIGLFIRTEGAEAQDRAQLPTPPSVQLNAVGGELINRYRISGVRDNGGAINTGVATSFHCTNWSTVSENIRIIVRNFDASVTSNNTFVVLSGRTHTASTHGTVAFNEDAFLSTGTVIEQGFALISSTSDRIVCSAMIVDAANASAIGVSLHTQRVNPFPNSQE